MKMSHFEKPSIGSIEQQSPIELRSETLMLHFTDVERGAIIRLQTDKANGYGAYELEITDRPTTLDDGAVALPFRTRQQLVEGPDERFLPRVANGDPAYIIADRQGRIITDEGLVLLFKPLHDEEYREVEVDRVWRSISTRMTSEASRERRRQEKRIKRLQKIQDNLELSRDEKRRLLNKRLDKHLEKVAERVLPERLFRASGNIIRYIGASLANFVDYPEKMNHDD